MDEASLVRKFQDADLCLSPEALEFLRKRACEEAAIERVLEGARMDPSKPLVVTEEMALRILEAGVPQPQVEPPKHASVESELRELAHKRFKPSAAEVEARAEVLLDITGRSYSQGELKNFVNLFSDRYERLSGIIRKRGDFQTPVPIGSLGGMEGETVRVIGMVVAKRETSSGNLVIEVEDRTGQASVWVFRGQGELMQKAAEVVVDEVVGIEGSVRSGDRTPRLLARGIVWPDLPTPREPARADEPVCAALISDLHIGSEMFLEDAFLKFIRWLRGEIGNAGQRELAGRVKYLLIAGDVIDGIGIYPRQEEELLIRDVLEQYGAAAELLGRVPEYITLIIAPGNHDAVRAPEPQPAISNDVAEGLYGLNSVMVGNPALVALHGVKFLIYHGRSFDDLVATVPGLSMERTAPMMIKLLQKRHLAPIYGGKTPLAPEDGDLMVIEEVPDVFHCGHAHVYGCERYRDVLAVNSGTFQETTIYMKLKGIRPTPGMVTVTDLQTPQPRVIHFG